MSEKSLPRAEAPAEVGVRRFISRHWLSLAVALGVLVYLACAWTPSHYGQTALALGIPDAGPVFGDSRPVRSDEWMVSTPYFQIAAAADFGAHDTISPYHEPLKAYFALPSRDWSMVFKPDLWGFLALDPAHAFSLHYVMLALAFVAGFAVVLRQFGAGAGVALAGSLILFLSQFVQVWWTSNAPVLAWAPWAAAAYLWRGPWYVRAPALAYVVAVWLIGQLYPPLVLAAGLAFAVLIAAFRPDALKPGRLASGLAGAAVGAAVAGLHYADLIPIMAATVYPGQRIANGGGLPPLQFLAQLFPYLVTQRFQPIPMIASNACEIAVVGSFLPLAVASFCDHRRLAAWAGERRWAVAIWLVGLLVMAGWMLAPIPGRLAPVFNLVPPGRMLWAFGLTLTLGVVLAADAGQWILSRRRIAVFCGLVIAAGAVSKFWLSPGAIELDRFDILIVPILLITLWVQRFVPRPLAPRAVILLTLLLTALVTFGSFNPIQPARPIFERRAGTAIDAFRAYARANPGGWVVAPGVWGAAINGAGVPAINHTLLQPQLATFRRTYPELEAASFDVMFNRYEHLMPAVQWAPTLVQGDLVAIPADPFAIALPVKLAPSLAAPADGAIEQVAATPLAPGRWGVVASGRLPWRGVSREQAITVALDPACGRVTSARAYRLPRPDAAPGPVDAAAFATGFGLRLEIEGTQAPGAACITVAMG